LILNRNHADDVLTLYKDLKKQTFQDFHVIIIDDNSDAAELEKLNSVTDEKFQVYSYPAPWKFGNDNKWNMGLKAAHKNGSKYTYSIQTDMKINDLDLLQRLVEFMEVEPKCGAACPTIYNASGEMTWGPGIEKTRMGKKLNINETFITRNSLMAEMGYVDEKLIFYGHESYFNNWLHLKGYNTIPLGGVSITHFGGGTTSKYWHFKYYYRARTTILLLKLFNHGEPLSQRLRYFRSECWEIFTKLSDYKKNRRYIDLLKLLIVFSRGILVGLVIQIKPITKASIQHDKNK